MENRHIQINRLMRAAGAAAGFLIFSLPFFYREGIAYALTELLGLGVFLYLIQTAKGKKELAAEGAALIAANIIRYHGLGGSLWLDTVLIGVVGTAVLAVMLAYRFCVKRWEGYLITLLFPVFWEIAQILFSVLRVPIFLRVDMMFYDILPLVQCEAYITGYGLSFVILWTISLAVYSIIRRRWSGIWTAAGVYAALIAAGSCVLAGTSSPISTVKAAYVTGPYIGDFMGYGDVDYTEKVASVNRSVDSAQKEGARILLFNEEAFTLEEEEENAFLVQVREAAIRGGLHILVGLDLGYGEDERRCNKLVWIDPQGEILDEYIKHNTIPGIESDYIRGEGDIPVLDLEIDGHHYRIAFAICYDSNFPIYLAGVRDKADFLILPSWDWEGVSALHYRICGVDAVSQRMTLIKPTYDGYSIAADPYGRILQLTNTKQSGFETVHCVEMPQYPRQIEAGQKAEPNGLRLAIIGAEAVGLLVCLVLLLANYFRTQQNILQRQAFEMVLLVNGLAMLADMISWLLDGNAGMSTLNYAMTAVSIVMSFVSAGAFIVYIYIHLYRRENISDKPFFAGICYCVLGAILTTFLSMSGSLFDVVDGNYMDGPLYGGYLVANGFALVAILIILVLNRKRLGKRDTLATLTYILFPVIDVVINGIVPDFSMVYPANTLSLLTIFIVLQSDHEGVLIQSQMDSYRLATHDNLTGLLNRQAFFDYTSGMAEEGEMGVLFCDANALKYTNDTYGHTAGDDLLCRLTKYLTERFSDTAIYRMSGDEFLVLLPDWKKEALHESKELLKNDFASEMFPIAAVGAAHGKKEDVFALISEAERDMYQEKEAFHQAYPMYCR